MKFIMKPAGIVVLLVALSGLAFLAFSPFSFSRSKRPQAAQAATDATPVYLLNRDFEGAYQTFSRGQTPTGGKAKISGRVAESWGDNSDWADLTVRYGVESKNPHRGAACQRIEIGPVRTGHVQFTQVLRVQPGLTYAASLWARASKPTEVEFGIRSLDPDAAGNFTFFATKTARVGTAWTELKASGTVTAPSVRLMVIAKGPNTTLWVDDARMDAARAAAAAAP